jgi:hypothetical protein
MKNKKTKEPKKDTQDTNTPEPDWLYDNPSDIIEPHTDEELDLFVEGFIQAHSNTQAWKETVRKFSKEKALQVLRDSFTSSDTRKNRKRTLVH